MQQIGYDTISPRGRWSELRIFVARHPFLSVLTALYDAVGGWHRGMAPEWRRNILRVLPAHAPATMRPFFSAGVALTPAHLAMPYDDVSGDVDFDAALCCLRGLRRSDLHNDLRVYGANVPPAWREVADDFERWLPAYAEILEATWIVMRPVWEHAETLLPSEIQRVGAAVVSGRTVEMLGSLSASAHTEGTRLLLPSVEPTELTIESDRLTLIPLISGTRFVAHDLDGADPAWIAYKLPGLEHIWPSGERSQRTGGTRPTLLEAAVGHARSEVLRCLDEPCTMGEIAERTFRSPAAVTAVVDRLVRADLAERQRDGKYVRVSLTPRGTALRLLLAD